ncbi:putative transcription factor C2H2 family [Helianthus annuus]|nr:putative transcription factor C2H2 family [Helianthus annuus]
MSKKNQSSSSFRPKFSLPIFPTLQLNFDAPVPVIIPPRSDPCLLNPNPYNDQVLETTSLTDIDPCVVAWRGSVANKVDLTADEHAGVSLSEPATMGSTALKTMDDVTWNSDKVLNKHMEENMLLKNTQNVTINQEPETKTKKNPDLENVTQIVSMVIEQETPSSVANDMLDQVSEKKKQDLLQKEVATKSLLACDYPKSLFVCDIPEPGREYQKIATVEVDQSLFKKPTSVKMTPVQPSNCGTQNRPTKLSVHQPNWCDICKVSCSGNNSFDKHIVGIQHQKNLKISEKTPTPPLTTIVTPMDTTPITKIMEESKKSVIVNAKNTWCEICKVSCPTNEYNRHASGKKHVKNLQKLEKIQTLPSTVIQSVTTPLAVPNLPSAVIQSVTTPVGETLKLTRGEVVNPNDGKKHQKKLKKTEQQSVSSPPPVPKTPLLEPMIEEGEIVFFEGSKRKTNDSLSSEEDADTKRLKMNEEEVACGVVVTCKVCNVGCNGLMAFKTHTASIEHSAMLLKLAKGGSNGLQI